MVFVSFVLQLCELCQQLIPADAPAIYSDHASAKKQWHPACFICCQCREPLVNLIHFWKNGRLWCGRHYCENEKPRCNGCDEVGGATYQKTTAIP